MTRTREESGLRAVARSARGSCKAGPGRSGDVAAAYEVADGEGDADGQGAEG
jgi:hypothetical protein